MMSLAELIRLEELLQSYKREAEVQNEEYEAVLLILDRLEHRLDKYIAQLNSQRQLSRGK